MSRFNPSPVSLSVTLGLMFSASAFAQDATKTDETMVVTAAGYAQVIQNAPASISVISREDLESRYYRDVTDALKSVPGVTVTGGGDTTDISIRGMGSNYTLILVDGKRQTSRQTRPNSDGPGIEQGWLPPLQAIERIEVIRGPMSTLYGSDAIGGVINIITRKDQQQWSGNVQLSTVVQENRASGDEQSANFFVTGPLSDALSLQVYGQTTQRDEDEIEHGYGDKSLRSLTSKLNYQLNPDHQLQLEAAYQPKIAKITWASRRNPADAEVHAAIPITSTVATMLPSLTKGIGRMLGSLIPICNMKRTPINLVR